MDKKIVIYIKDPINAQYEVDCALNDRLHKLCDELNQLIGKKIFKESLKFVIQLKIL